MSGKERILPAADRLDRDRLLQDAEALHQASQAAQREQWRQMLQPTFRTHWEHAVADLTRDPSLDLGREATIAEACPVLAKAWQQFSVLLHEAGLSSRALQLQPDTNDARTAAVELFHHAARGASTDEFESDLLVIASQPDLWRYHDHVPDLARQIWPGNSSGRPQATEEATSQPLQQEPAEPEPTPAPQPPASAARRRRWRLDEANERAKQLLGEKPSLAHGSLRQWADAIGCSQGLVAKLPLWRAIMQRTGRGKSGKTPAPKTVSFTSALERAVGDQDPELQRLIKEQTADAEPSPLEDDPPAGRPRKVRSRRRP